MVQRKIACWIWVWLLAACGLSAQAQSVNQVLVVVNDNSPTSTTLGAYYAAVRSIPTVNICHVRTPDSAVSTINEDISYTNFVNNIQTPILAYITQNNLDIDYIVLTKGIPIRVDGDANGPACSSFGSHTASVDSLLVVSRDYNAKPNVEFSDTTNYVFAVTWYNNYWNATTHYSHAVYGGFLVTRLDGYTLADAEALVDRAQQAGVLVGNWICDVAPHYGDSTHVQPRGLLDKDFGSYTYGDYNRDIITAGQYLLANAIPGVLINNAYFPANATFVGHVDNVAGYVSWGSNAGAPYTRALYNSLQFLPGSIAETAVSGSGRTFLNRNAAGQSLIADLITQGVTGCKGYVYEPELFGIASPTVLFDHYTQGYNLAESFYAASRFVGWMDIVVGDPLTLVTVPRTPNVPIPFRNLPTPSRHR